jgi:carboxyl-terminal processing protease
MVAMYVSDSRNARAAVVANNGTAIKLTTARYFTPSGRSIQAKGIAPDIVVEEATITTSDGAKMEVREADLDKHLANNQEAESGKDAKPKEDKAKDKKSDDSGAKKEGKDKLEPGEVVSKNDYQYNQALILLKGLSLLQNRKD